MQTPDDMSLVREFAEQQNEAAFEALVTRHVNLVYSAALRQVGDAHTAEEVTQAVFIILARKAGSLRPGTFLTGWLFKTTRYAARAELRARVRRLHRETQAYMDHSQIAEDEAWPQIAPLLDEALANLGETDRRAVLLRYFERKTLAEVGATLGVNEDAARKRVDRGLEKLRKLFGKRGVTLTATVIASVVGANSVQAAPVNLVANISLVAGKGSAATTTITALVKATMKTMTWNKIKILMAIGAAIILAGGTATVFAQHSGKPSDSVAQIPYKILEDGWLFQQSINPTNLTFHFLVGSHTKGVRNQDIRLTIESATKGKIPVRLGDRGQLLDFPCDDDLRRENPFVVSDQPKGTLGIGYWVYVPRPEGTTFRYNILANAVEEANKAAVRANKMAKEDFGGSMPMFPGTVNAVGLVFPHSAAGKANVTIMTADGPKNYVADAHGEIKLRINPKLQAENPELVFSQRPDWIGIGHF